MNKTKILFTSIATLAVSVIVVATILILVYAKSEEVTFAVIIFILLFDSAYGLYIINSRRAAEIKVCWILIILLIPLVGPLIFTMFGINQLGKKRWKEYNSEQVKFLKHEHYEFSNEYIQNEQRKNNCFQTALASTFRPIYKNNNVQAIENNQDLYKITIDLIRSAEKCIHIQMYLVRDGFWSRAIMTELAKKAQQGVEVRFIYDWVGCLMKTKRKTWNELKKSGVQVGIFNPRGFNVFKGTTNFRSHRKMIIIDNKRGLCGGSNIGDEYLGMSSHTNSWQDLNFLIEGEILNTMNVIFCSDWINFTKHSVSKKNKEKVLTKLDNIFEPYKAKEEMIAQVMETSPNFDEKVIKSNICNLIYRAKKSIYLCSPYLCPTPDIVDALKVAARDGIDVRILVPGERDDKSYIIAFNRNNYLQFVQSGCKIYEYNGFIHSKYMVVDEETVFLGSYNLDYRSLWVNFENALLVTSQKLSEETIRIFQRDKSNSVEVDEKITNQYRTPWVRMLGWFLKIFYPLL